MKSEALLYLGDGHGLRKILFVGKHQEKCVTQLILIQLITTRERGGSEGGNEEGGGGWVNKIIFVTFKFAAKQ